jgi:aminomethyltransferase
MSELLKTPLHDWHHRQGGQMVDFAGWSMPVQYASIVAEHVATRSAAGIFDISHMGRVYFEGPDAEPFLDRVLTRRVQGLGAGKIRYALVTDAKGGILDDVLVYHLVKPDGGSLFALVVNASNRGKILAWLRRHGGDADSVGLRDRTLETAMIAVQGPLALELVKPLVGTAPSELRYYESCTTLCLGHECVVSRTGYTGEDGCELIVPADQAMDVWEALLPMDKPSRAQPAGLGARDTLRLEAGMPLYGHELSEQLNPFQAGLGFAVQLRQHEFIGSEALQQLADDTSLPQRVGLELEGKRIAREHFPVTSQDGRVGEVSSGTFSPTLERPIAMAYVRPEVAAVGTSLAVDIRGRAAAARVVPLPFYQRSRT